MKVPMSLTYTTKISGPSTDPWGTPQFVCKWSEQTSPKRTKAIFGRHDVWLSSKSYITPQNNLKTVPWKT